MDAVGVQCLAVNGEKNQTLCLQFLGLGSIAEERMERIRETAKGCRVVKQLLLN